MYGKLAPRTPEEVGWSTRTGNVWHAYSRRAPQTPDLKSPCGVHLRTRKPLRSEPGPNVCSKCRDRLRRLGLTPEEETMAGPKPVTQSQVKAAVADAVNLEFARIDRKLDALQTKLDALGGEQDAFASILTEQLPALKGAVMEGFAQLPTVVRGALAGALAAHEAQGPTTVSASSVDALPAALRESFGSIGTAGEAPPGEQYALVTKELRALSHALPTRNVAELRDFLREHPVYGFLFLDSNTFSPHDIRCFLAGRYMRPDKPDYPSIGRRRTAEVAFALQKIVEGLAEEGGSS